MHRWEIPYLKEKKQNGNEWIKEEKWIQYCIKWKRRDSLTKGMKAMKHNVVCILILYVHREPLLWLQLDVVTSWRGLNFIYMQVSNEPFSIWKHRNIRVHIRNFQSLGNNDDEMRWNHHYLSAGWSYQEATQWKRFMQSFQKKKHEMLK